MHGEAKRASEGMNVIIWELFSSATLLLFVLFARKPTGVGHGFYLLFSS